MQSFKKCMTIKNFLVIWKEFGQWKVLGSANIMSNIIMCLEFRVKKLGCKTLHLGTIKKKHNIIDAHVFSHARVIEYWILLLETIQQQNQNWKI